MNYVFGMNVNKRVRNLINILKNNGNHLATYINIAIKLNLLQWPFDNSQEVHSPIICTNHHWVHIQESDK